MRYLLVFNPIAGRGRAARVAREIEERLTVEGVAVELAASERAGHIRDLAAASRGRCDRLLSLGGDGSLREAACGLLELPKGERPELGVVPFGTGNVVARELELPLDPVEAAVAIVGAGARPFDVGMVTAEGEDGAPRPAEPFLAMLGIGFDAMVAERMDRARHRKRTAAWYRTNAESLYVAISGRVALFDPHTRFHVTIDGERREEPQASAVLSNVETYAKGMTMTPGADAGDGELDLHMRRSGSAWRTVAAMWAAQRRLVPGRGTAELVRGRGFRFEAEGGGTLAWQLDGDSMERARGLVVDLLPAELSLVTGSARWAR